MSTLSLAIKLPTLPWNAVVNNEKIEGTSEAGEYNATIITENDYDKTTTVNYALARRITKLPDKIDLSFTDELQYAFCYLEKVEEFPEIIVHPNLKSTNFMFNGCKSATKIEFFNTSSVKNTNNMFSYCHCSSISTRNNGYE